MPSISNIPKEYTEADQAQWILENWDTVLPKFVKVFPHEYKRVLGAPRLGAEAVARPAASAAAPFEVMQVVHG